MTKRRLSLVQLCATRDIRRKGWQKSRHQGTSIHIHHQHSKKRILRPRRRSVFNVGTYRAAVQSQQAKLWTTTIKFKCRFTCLQSFYDLLSWNKSLCFKGNRDDTGMTPEWKNKSWKLGFAPVPSAGKASGKRFPGLAASDLPWDPRSKVSAAAMSIESVMPNEGARTRILCGLPYVDHGKKNPSTSSGHNLCSDSTLATPAESVSSFSWDRHLKGMYKRLLAFLWHHLLASSELDATISIEYQFMYSMYI